MFSLLKSISCLILSIMGQGLLWNNLTALKSLWCKALASIEYVVTLLMQAWHILSTHKGTAPASLWQPLWPGAHLKMKTSWALQLSFLLTKKLNISEAMIPYMLLWGKFITKARGWLLQFVWGFLAPPHSSGPLQDWEDMKVKVNYRYLSTPSEVRCRLFSDCGSYPRCEAMEKNVGSMKEVNRKKPHS